MLKELRGTLFDTKPNWTEQLAELGGKPSQPKDLVF